MKLNITFFLILLLLPAISFASEDKAPAGSPAPTSRAYEEDASVDKDKLFFRRRVDELLKSESDATSKKYFTENGWSEYQKFQEKRKELYQGNLNSMYPPRYLGEIGGHDVGTHPDCHNAQSLGFSEIYDLSQRRGNAIFSVPGLFEVDVSFTLPAGCGYGVSLIESWSFAHFVPVQQETQETMRGDEAGIIER